MKDLGYILFGIVAGLAVAIVFAGLTWAGLRDGADERAFRERLAATPEPTPALAPAAA